MTRLLQGGETILWWACHSPCLLSLQFKLSASKVFITSKYQTMSILRVFLSELIILGYDHKICNFVWILLPHLGLKTRFHKILLEFRQTIGEGNIYEIIDISNLSKVWFGIKITDKNGIDFLDSLNTSSIVLYPTFFLWFYPGLLQLFQIK